MTIINKGSVPFFLNQIAFDVVRRATGEVQPDPVDEKKKAAQEAGRKGGLIGGKARAKSLPVKKRSAIAKKAAQGRWKAR